MKRRVCMLVSNEVLSDPRVTKEASTLSPFYQLSVVGLRRSPDVPATAEGMGYTVIRVNSFDEKPLARMTLMGILKTIWRRLVTFSKIAMAAYRENAAVYHAHDFDMLPFASLVARLRRARIIYDSHELWTEQRADFPNWLKHIVKRVEGYFMRRTDANITVNQSIAMELHQRYNLSMEPIVLHNFVEIQHVPPPTQRTDNEKIVLLYHGGFLKDRGLEELIQSMKHLPAHYILRLRGAGPLEERLRCLADPFVRQGRIEFCEPVPMKELVKLAAEADIGIIPYKPTCLNNYFSLPNKLSEYVMAGLAVCASDLPEIRKINQNVHFGALFNPSDPLSIANAVIKVASDKQNLDQCRKNARFWAIEEGNWEKERGKLLALYADIMGEDYEAGLDR